MNNNEKNVKEKKDAVETMTHARLMEEAKKHSRNQIKRNDALYKALATR